MPWCTYSVHAYPLRAPQPRAREKTRGRKRNAWSCEKKRISYIRTGTPVPYVASAHIIRSPIRYLDISGQIPFVPDLHMICTIFGWDLHGTHTWYLPCGICMLHIFAMWDLHATALAHLSAKKPLHTGVRTRCHYLLVRLCVCQCVTLNSSFLLIARAVRGRFPQTRDMEAGEYGLTRGTCFLACRLELDAVAGLL